MKKNKKRKKNLAGDGFDPSTFGLWAQHAPAAPPCWLMLLEIKLITSAGNDADRAIQGIACKVVSSSSGYTVHMLLKHCTILLNQQYVHVGKPYLTCPYIHRQPVVRSVFY